MTSSRKPWPMRWVLLAIVLFLIPYTYLTLHFRKPGPAYQPYQDGRELKHLGELGYRRVTITAIRPTESPACPAAATIAAAAPSHAGGPRAHRSPVKPPLLPGRRSAASSPRPICATRHPIRSNSSLCLLSDDAQQLSGCALYVKGAEVYIVPTFERLPNGLTARTRQNLIALTFPSDALPPGKLSASCWSGQSALRGEWSLQVH